jgi:hypothetical protein
MAWAANCAPLPPRRFEPSASADIFYLSADPSAPRTGPGKLQKRSAFDIYQYALTAPDAFCLL